MFLLNSRLSLVAAIISGFGREVLHLIMTPLLPKLRGYFAEFLRESYLAHLGILYLTTCGGFGYGHHSLSLRQFSRQHGIYTVMGAYSLPYLASVYNALADLPTRTTYAVGRTMSIGYAVYSLLRPDLVNNLRWWHGNINPLCIGLRLSASP